MLELDFESHVFKIPLQISRWFRGSFCPKNALPKRKPRNTVLNGKMRSKRKPKTEAQKDKFTGMLPRNYFEQICLGWTSSLDPNQMGLGHTSACEMDLPICFGSRSWKGNFGIDCSDDAQDPECPNWKRITAIMHYILTLGSYIHDALFVDNVLLQPSCIVCWLQLTAPCPDLGTGRGDLLSNAACVAEKAGEASFTSRMDGLSWLVALTAVEIENRQTWTAWNNQWNTHHDGCKSHGCDMHLLLNNQWSG